MKNNKLNSDDTQLSKDDLDWLALLAGESVDNADPKTVSEATHLRALLTPLSSDEPIESGLNAIKSTLESEGYVVSRKRESRFHWLSEWLMNFQLQWRKIVAVPITLAIGFLLIRMFPDNGAYNINPPKQAETESAVQLPQLLKSKGSEFKSPTQHPHEMKQRIQNPTSDLKTSAEGIQSKLKGYGISPVVKETGNQTVEMSINLAHLSSEKFVKLGDFTKRWEGQISPLEDIKNSKDPTLYISIHGIKQQITIHINDFKTLAKGIQSKLKGFNPVVKEMGNQTVEMSIDLADLSLEQTKNLEKHFKVRIDNNEISPLEDIKNSKDPTLYITITQMTQ